MTRAVTALLAVAATASGRRFPPRGGAWFGRGKAADAASNATDSKDATMTEVQIADILKAVPVFCLSNDKGQPVLLQQPDAAGDAKPTQAFFTDFDVARLHAARIANETGNADLKLAVLDLGSCMSSLDAEDRVVALLADPRELHAARQLVLRSAGYSNGTDASDPKVVDFTSPTAIAEACRAACPAGVDLDAGVPLFSIKSLNATVRGADVQPWFLSFADLVRAYVNSTAAPEDAAAGLEALLEQGGVVVGTVDSVLAHVRAPGARRAFLLPPASSLAVMQAQNEASAPAADARAAAPAPAEAELAAMASSDGGGLFD